MRWILRPQYFHGPGPYKLSASGRAAELQVDASGTFELPNSDDFPIGIYAKGPWVKHQTTQASKIRRFKMIRRVAEAVRREA